MCTNCRPVFVWEQRPRRAAGWRALAATEHPVAAAPSLRRRAVLTRHHQQPGRRRRRGRSTMSSAHTHTAAQPRPGQRRRVLSGLGPACGLDELSSMPDSADAGLPLQDRTGPSLTETGRSGPDCRGVTDPTLHPPTPTPFYPAEAAPGTPGRGTETRSSSDRASPSYLSHAAGCGR